MKGGLAESLSTRGLDTDTVPNFNGLAVIYRWLEWFSFGPVLWYCRCAFLKFVRDQRTALIFGDGDGRFASRLLRENTHVTIDAVDASLAMLRETNKRAGLNGSRIQVHCSDARRFVPTRHQYDLIVTHFFLDCLNTDEVIDLAIRIRKHLSGNAIWIVSEFAVPSGWYGQTVAEPLIHLLYLAFGWLTGLNTRQLPDHRFALSLAGFSLTRERKWFGGLLVSEMWKLSPQSQCHLPDH
jgi:hypothetical protein